ncbi:hypothetical protein [Oceanobacillus senegalensis]|nr:hypothetical protein [Oceanobacillus senegalensis]
MKKLNDNGNEITVIVISFFYEKFYGWFFIEYNNKDSNVIRHL